MPGTRFKLLILVLFLLPFYVSSKTVTLEEAIDISRAAHPILALEKEKTYELRFKIDEAWVDYFPRLASEGGYTNFEREEFKDWGLRLRYPLFEGGRVVSEYRLSESNEKVAQARVEITESLLTLNVKHAYVNVLVEEKLLSAVQTEKENLAKLFTIAESLFSLGKIPQSDLIRIKTRLLESESMIIEEERKRDVAKSVLLQLLNWDQREDVEAVPLDSHVFLEGFTLDEALEIAQAQRPEFREFHYRERGLESELGLARSDYWPRVYLDGQYGGSNNPMDHMFMRRDLSNFDEFWSVGINIEIDFWNWGKAQAKERQTRSRTRQLQHEKGGFLNSLSFEVKDAYLSWRAAQRNVLNMRELLNSSKQAYEIIMEEYQTGRATNEVVLETQNQLTQSQKAYDQAFFEVFNTEFKLQWVLGALTGGSAR